MVIVIGAGIGLMLALFAYLGYRTIQGNADTEEETAKR
jgi:hypothetical protein